MAGERERRRKKGTRSEESENKTSKRKHRRRLRATREFGSGRHQEQERFHPRDLLTGKRGSGPLGKLAIYRRVDLSRAIYQCHAKFPFGGVGKRVGGRPTRPPSRAPSVGSCSPPPLPCPYLVESALRAEDRRPRVVATRHGEILSLLLARSKERRGKKKNEAGFRTLEREKMEISIAIGPRKRSHRVKGKAEAACAQRRKEGRKGWRWRDGLPRAAREGRRAAQGDRRRAHPEAVQVQGSKDGAVPLRLVLSPEEPKTRQRGKLDTRLALGPSPRERLALHARSSTLPSSQSGGSGMPSLAFLVGPTPFFPSLTGAAPRPASCS